MGFSTSHPPRLSIGLPVYNGERYISQAIDSILRQSFQDFRITISDNASTDMTQEICHEYVRKDERIKYSRNSENIGAAPNFNKSFIISPNSEYFKWATYDDIISDGFLEAMVRTLDDDPRSVLACAPIAYVDTEGQILRHQECHDWSLRDVRAGQRVRRFITYGLRTPDIYWTIYGVARREALTRTELHGSYVASDQVFLFQLALLGHIVQTPGELFLRREHPRAWTMMEDRKPSSDAAWFDTEAQRRVHLPHWTLLQGQLRSTMRLRVSSRDRLDCGLAMANWGIHEWRKLGGDVKRALRDSSGK